MAIILANNASSVSGFTGNSGLSNAEISNNFVLIQNALNASKIYRAVLTQSGTSAPTVTVIENSFGSDFTWAYSSTGVYTATLTGAFTANKTFTIISGVAGVATAVRTDANTITVSSYSAIGTAANGVLSGTCIEIRVFS